MGNQHARNGAYCVCRNCKRRFAWSWSDRALCWWCSTGSRDGINRPGGEAGERPVTERRAGEFTPATCDLVDPDGRQGDGDTLGATSAGEHGLGVGQAEHQPTECRREPWGGRLPVRGEAKTGLHDGTPFSVPTLADLGLNLRGDKPLRERGDGSEAERATGSAGREPAKPAAATGSAFDPAAGSAAEGERESRG